MQEDKRTITEARQAPEPERDEPPTPEPDAEKGIALFPHVTGLRADVVHKLVSKDEIITIVIDTNIGRYVVPKKWVDENELAIGDELVVTIKKKR